MHKRIVLYLIVFVMLLNAVKGASLSVEWSQPSKPRTVVGGSGSLVIIPKVYCQNGPCNDIQITIEYCLGTICTDYQPICYSSCTNEPISVDLYWNETPENPCNAKYDTGGDFYYCWWWASIPFPDYYGETIKLRAKATSSNAGTAYATGREYYVDSPPTITLTNPTSKITLGIGNQLPIRWSIGTDPEGDRQRTNASYCKTTYPYDCQEIYYTDNLTVPADLEYNWTIPNIEPREYNIIVKTWFAASATASQTITIAECNPPGTQQNCTTTEGCNGTQTCQANYTWGSCQDNPGDNCPAPIATIISPSNGSTFMVGSTIDFKSNIVSYGSPYTVQWDSNKDLDWKSSDENFSSSALSIGDHNISLKADFEIAGFGTVTEIDSVNIRINPIPSDVFAVVSFTVKPEKNLTRKDSIDVNAVIANYSSEDLNADVNLLIVNAETGIEVISYVNKNIVVKANDSNTVSYNVPLASFGEGNYKVKLNVTEYNKEQNKENNHATKIITVLEESREVKASELSLFFVPLLVIAVLLILNRKRIKEKFKKKVTE
jgi:hypothetical protein